MTSSETCWDRENSCVNTRRTRPTITMTEGHHRILYVDAYDSFTSNIAAFLTQKLHAEVTVIQIDETAPDSTALLDFAAIVFGPGPGHPDNPNDVGSILQILNIATEKGVPLLGICLGFQVLCSTYGLPIHRLPIPCHGHAKQILHSDDDIFQGVGMVVATCYNSLGVRSDIDCSRPSSRNSDLSIDTDRSASSSDLSLSQKAAILLGNPKTLQLLARDGDGYLMAIKHERLPHWGFQFHPESCKSNAACNSLLENWWTSVIEWNQQSRAYPPQRVLSMIPHGVPASTRLTNHFLQHLLKLTEFSGPYVRYTRIEDRGSIAQISEICRSLTINTSTAVLESVGKGRYSIYAIPSPSLCRVEHLQGVSTVTLIDGGHAISNFCVNFDECLSDVERLISIRRANGGDASLPFWGGFLGFMSYKLGLGLLKVDVKDHFRSTPDLSLLWVERSIVVDHYKGTTTIQSIRNDDEHWLDKMTEMIKTGFVQSTGNESSVSPEDLIRSKAVLLNKEVKSKPGSAFQEALMSSNAALPNEADYKSKIVACQEQLKAGNSYELCLTTEAEVCFEAGNHWELYKNLRLCNPAPFAAYVQLGDMSIISSSPEQFMAWDREGSIDMIPMKGTVRKSASMTFARAAEILASPKEQAENLMIADLVRHDLYSALGLQAIVSVEKLCEVVEHETVYQLVSHIRAIAPVLVDCGAKERQEHAIHYGHKALRHALPPGSMTGAPKKRSCEILSAIENRPRGVYSGVLGYLDVGGGGCFSVCIRTAFSNSAEIDENGRQTWRIGAGGAITVLSDPEEEWQEMQTKLESTLRAFRPRQVIS